MCENCDSLAIRDFEERGMLLQSMLETLCRREPSARVLVSVFVNMIIKVTWDDSKDSLDYKGKIEQVVKVLQETISD